MPKKFYSREFKVEAVKLVIEQGYKATDAGLKNLRNELEKVKRERDILKKSLVNSISHCNTSVSLICVIHRDPFNFLTTLKTSFKCHS